MRDFGAEVVRVGRQHRSTLDAGVEFERVWNRGKELLEVAEPDVSMISALLSGIDVLLLAGPEESVERFGLGYGVIARHNPRLVGVRIRPGVDALGTIPDYELLAHARSGLLTQFISHREGPAFCDLAVAGAGAGLSAAVGALARLYHREVTGEGGWVETSLHAGMQSILAMIIGRVELPSTSTASLWQGLGPSLALSFRCADGEYIQLWFGAKGAYEAFLEHIKDPPSEAGYSADSFSGVIGERSLKWADLFATRERDWWIEDLAGNDFRCEPVLRPGQILADPHLRRIGLSIDVEDPGRGPITVLGPLGRVAPAGARGPHPAPSDGSFLSGVRVLDLSAYLAGPVAPQIVAELGADVIKVEPVSGDVHRGVEPMFAAGQRGKRAVALDLKSPDAREVLHRLFRWSDVLHHNSRVGLAERLGYDEETVRSVNPNVVYSHSSGFGADGPRALLPANDHLMQALSGVEAAVGGAGEAPTFLPWGAIDVASGWVAAAAILCGLLARRRTGSGQTVASTLLGAGIALKSGAFLADGKAVEGPLVDAQQTGYGATYRIYQAGDGQWLALVVPDLPTWNRLRRIVERVELPGQPPPLRTAPGERQPAETLLEEVFSTKDAGDWVSVLTGAGIPVELVVESDRAGFIARMLDDPVGRQLGRVVTFQWGARGTLEQPAFPLRFGPHPPPSAPDHIPALGEHTNEVLVALGFDGNRRAELEASGSVFAATSPGDLAAAGGGRSRG
jgi:crotonobetainyl-CoA:carnitine CoA-transferase CaiB-like acyl-CoA transferase